MAKKKKFVGKIILWVIVLIIVGVLAAMPLIAKEKEVSDGPKASILSGIAVKTDISKTIIGGGTVQAENAETVYIPSEIKVTEFLVKNGDTVQEGDAIAKVDRVTVMTAIKSVQETLEKLSEDIETEKSKTTDGVLKALAGGIVKQLYAEKGASVQEIMLENGALVVLSLDGLMAVEISIISDIAVGSNVNVILSDGTSVSGSVVSNLLGKMTVTIEDNDYAEGETVKIVASDNTEIGSGTLYIYSPWKLTSYSGTVKEVKVEKGDTLKAGQTILTLSDGGASATYQKLLSERATYEDLMLQLFEMYQTETIKAENGGVINGIDKTVLLNPEKSSRKVKLLSNAPLGDADGLYRNYFGKVSLITETGWALSVNPQNIGVENYLDITEIPQKETFTELEIFYPQEVPVYENTDGTWKQIQYTDVKEQDTLLFACDDTGKLVWVVRVEKFESEPAPTLTPTSVPQATPASTPAGIPETSFPPANTSAPQTSAVPQGTPNTTQMPQFSGNAGFDGNSGFQNNIGNANGLVQNGNFGSTGEVEFQLYPLEVAQIASITPQDSVTVQITVNELDISELSLGMEATVQIDALGGEKFSAIVSDISNNGENNGGYSYFTVTLTLPKSENILIGMNTTVTIITKTIESVISIPVEALKEKGNSTVIYTGYDEENSVLINEKEVMLGVSDGINVEIISGISEGETYYYEYYDTLVVSDAPDFSSGGLGNFGGGRR